MSEPADRASLDSLLNFLMSECPPELVIGGSYRVVDLVSDLLHMAERERIVDLPALN